MKVAIVGGGVIGLCCAFALVESGAEVVVLERNELGSGASAGNTGWVSPSLSTPLASPGVVGMGLRSALDRDGALIIRPGLDVEWLRWLWRFRRAATRDRYEAGIKALYDLNRQTMEQLDHYRAVGVDFEMHETGILAVAFDRKGLGWFEPLFEELRGLGYEGTLEPMDGDQARSVEPALGPAVGWATRTTVDSYVRPESLMAGIAAHLRARGVPLREQVSVTGLGRDGLGWIVETSGGGGERVGADAVLVASGVGSVDLLRPLGIRLPIVGAKGYSVTMRGTGTVPRHALYLTEAKLGLSPYDGGMRIAGFFELPGRSLAPDPRRIGLLVDQARRYLADWTPDPAAAASREGWAGFRPATPDSLPLLGAVRDHPGLFLATGHGMLGVTLAPATGHVMADVIAHGARPPWLAPFSPDRRF